MPGQSDSVFEAFRLTCQHWLPAWTLLVGACNGKMADDAPTFRSGNGGTAQLSATGAATQAEGPGVWGEVEVSMRASHDATGVEDFWTEGPSAALYDGPYPTYQRPVLMQDGACSLFAGGIPKCSNPECSVTELCETDEQCAALPNRVANFDLEFRGLRLDDGSTEFSVVTDGVSTYPKVPGLTWLAFPPCNPGDPIHVSGGANLGMAFELDVKCIEALPDMFVRPHVKVESGRPLTFSWPAPTVATNTRMRIVFNAHINCRAGAQVICDVADNGEFEVGATLMTELFKYPWSGHPYAIFIRYASSEVHAGSGTFEVRIATQSGIPLDVPGLFSCMDSSECPSGMVCHPACPGRNTCQSAP